MAEEKPPLTPIIVCLILVVAIAGVGMFFYLDVNKPIKVSAPLLVQEGDNVTVNYIGIFGSGFDQGKVFDTSYLSIARDNASYPKAVSFTFRGASGYTPLSAHVGPNTEGSYTSLITGFWTAMVGIPVNDTVRAVIPPSQGYGAANPADVQVLPLTQELPMITSYSPAGFGKAFSNMSAQVGAVFTDPHYGWEDTVLSENSTSVTVESTPHVGEVVKPFGWPVTVTNVSSTTSLNGTITIVNDLTPQSVGEFKGTNWVNGKAFFLSNVSLSAQTYTMNYNQEVQGNTLIFYISVYKIVNT